MKCNNLKRWLLSFCAAIAMVIQFSQPYALVNTSYQYGKYEEIFFNFRYSLQNNFFVVSILFFAFCFIGLYLDKKFIVELKAYILVEWLIVLCWICAKAYMVDNTLDSIFITNGQLVKTIVVAVGYYYIIHCLYKAFVILISSDIDISNCNNKLTKFICSINNKYPFAIWVVLISIFAIPHALICYPGIMCNDTWTQVMEYLGSIEFTTHHPIMHTLLVGWCLEIGNIIGSINIGLFIYVAIQVTLFILVFSYSLYLMNKWNVKKYIVLLTYIIIIICPYFMMYSGVVIKDSIYSYFSLLFIIEVIQVMIDKEYWMKKSHWVLMFVSIFGTITMRNNGRYIVLPTIVVMFIYLLKKKNNIKNSIKYILIVVVFVTVANITNNACIKLYDIGEHCVVDALSIPVQQTARYVKEYETEITEYEREVLNKVFDYEKLKTAYDPRISDPVKNIFRREATDEQIKEYFIVWLKMFKKHPNVYFEATMNQNYSMISPMKDYAFIFTSTFLSKDIKEMKILDGVLYSAEKLDRMKHAREYIAMILFVLPGVSLFSNYAFYNLVFIALLQIVFRKKQYKLLIPMIPLMFSDLIVLAAPVVDARYAFPLIYSIPIMVALVTKEVRSKNNEEDCSIDTML